MSRFSKIQSRSSADSTSVPKIRKPEGVVPRKGSGIREVREDEYSDPYSAFLEKADEAFFTGEFKQSLKFYSKCLQLDSTQVYPWVGQLNALVAMNQLKEAMLWAERALEQFTEEPTILNQKARVMGLNGNIKRALASSDYALTVGTTPHAWLARGEILLEARDSNYAYCFEKAMEGLPQDEWKIPFLIAMAYSRKRMWSNAQSYYQISLDRNGKNFYIWQRMGYVLMEQSRLDKARDALETAIALNPECRESKVLLERVDRRPFLKRLMGMFRR